MIKHTKEYAILKGMEMTSLESLGDQPDGLAVGIRDFESLFVNSKQSLKFEFKSQGKIQSVQELKMEYDQFLSKLQSELKSLSDIEKLYLEMREENLNLKRQVMECKAEIAFL